MEDTTSVSVEIHTYLIIIVFDIYMWMELQYVLVIHVCEI